MSTPNTKATPLVDTNGWHTVSAVTYRDINKSITAQKASPATWAEKASDGSASVTGGTFGVWQLTTGGGNENLMVSIPLTGGTLTVGTASVPIPACAATVKVKLNYLPQPGQKMDLRVSLTAPAGEDVASVEDLQPPVPGFLNNAALKQLLETWLNENLQDFTALFATVDLSADFAHEGMSWLQPSWHGYAVAELAEGATPDNSVFAVLCLIGGDTNATGLANQVSPFAIPEGAEAGFLIAPEIMVKQMLMPSMHLMFKGIEPGETGAYFTPDNAGTGLTNSRQVTMNDFKMPNGKVVEDATVDAGQFSVEIDGKELVITSNGISFGYLPGIGVKLNFSGRFALSFDPAKNIMHLTANHCIGSGSVEIKRGLEIALILVGVAGVVTAIVGAFGGAVSKVASTAIKTATAAAITAAEAAGEAAPVAAEISVTCLRGLITGTAVGVGAIGARFAVAAGVGIVGGIVTSSLTLVPTVLKAMADGNYQDTPKVSDLLNAAFSEAVIWPGGVPQFTLASAQLNGALQFGLVDAKTEV